MTSLLSCHCAGYLLYDTSNMLVYFKYLGDPSAIVHHMLFMLAAAYVLDQSIMAFPFIWLALGEISTPSVNLRWGCPEGYPSSLLGSPVIASSIPSRSC